MARPVGFVSLSGYRADAGNGPVIKVAEPGVDATGSAKGAHTPQNGSTDPSFLGSVTTNGLANPRIAATRMMMGGTSPAIRTSASTFAGSSSRGTAACSRAATSALISTHSTHSTPTLQA